MQIRCTQCARAVTVASTGVLPERCPHCQQAPVPAQLGKWQIERLLAAGGMGEVYLARHRDLKSLVAIKLLPQTPGGDPEALRLRFLREARLTAAIDHDGVVRVLDCETEGDRSFLVLEYLDGRSLRSLLQDGPLPQDRAVAVALDVADVLAAAHQQGVVHRDIKPENVLVTRDGAVRVLDFGIAKALQDDEPLTRTGEILGTPEYMAPEQLLEGADAISARTDVHALGVLLYELLTGRSPFHGQNLFAVLKLVESLQPPPPSQLRPGVPPGLDALVLQCLHKEPAARPRDAGAFAQQLRGLTAIPGSASPLPRIRPKWPWLLAIAGAFALGLWLAWPAASTAPPAVTAMVPSLTELLAQPAASPAALRAGIAALGEVSDGAGLLLRGRARLQLGAFTQALQDLDAAVRRGDGAAAEPAAAAWLCANQLLPAVLDAPPWLGAIDQRRRDRLFGLGNDDARTLPDTPLAQAMLQLARGDAAAALATLRPPAGQRLTEPAATVALLAGYRAAADRSALRQLLPELRPERPGPGFLLLAAGLQGGDDLAAALRALREELDASCPDRWLCELGLAYLETAGGGEREPRLRSAAELAWLTGAGERAPLWCVGLRLGLAVHPGHALLQDEARRLLHLLGGGDASDHPARAAALALLHTATGEPQFLAADLAELPSAMPPALQPFASWRAATAGPLRRLWDGYARCLLGMPDGVAMLQALRTEADQGATAQLLLSVLANGAGPVDWPTALRGDFSMLTLLAPLPATPWTWLLDDAVAANPTLPAANWLPALRLYAALGNDPAPLLQQPALQTLTQPPLQADYQREVQGVIERR